MNEFNQLLHEHMRSQGEATYKKFLACEVISHWKEIVDESISSKVKPVTIERGVLFVDVKNSAFRDQLKFFAEEIIDAINETFRQKEPLVKKIRLASPFQIANMPQEKNPPAQVVEEELKLEDVTLTEEEKIFCERQAEKISEPKLRQSFLEMLLSNTRLKKFRLASGWHKCKNCESLCPPKEIFCEVCIVKAREEMFKALSKILFDAPWLKAWDAQKILLERMPYMKNECSLDVVESARSSLIQRIASRIRFGDEKSPDVLKAVMLRKRLPPEQLTPAIIKRTLFELQGNIPEARRFR